MRYELTRKHSQSMVGMKLLDRIASDTVIDEAYLWLRKRRRHYPANADVWSLRQRWPLHKRHIQADLRAGRYRFSPLERIQRKDQDDIDLWSARDALVLKALTIALAPHLPVSPRCTHIKGNGGSKYSRRTLWIALKCSMLRT